jgi:hypothetical protein
MFLQPLMDPIATGNGYRGRYLSNFWPTANSNSRLSSLPGDGIHNFKHALAAHGPWRRYQW